MCDDEEEEIDISGYVQENTEVVYCNDVEALIQRNDELRKTRSSYFRWGLDHGKGYMKVVLQQLYGPDYVDSVKGCLLLAVTTAPETNLMTLIEPFQLL